MAKAAGLLLAAGTIAASPLTTVAQTAPPLRIVVPAPPGTQEGPIHRRRPARDAMVVSVRPALMSTTTAHHRPDRSPIR